MSIKKKESGIGLVEVIAALGIAVVVLTSLVSLSIFTLRASLRGKLLSEGSKFSNREMEWIRAYRDSTSWEVFKMAFSSCTSDFCHMQMTAGSGVSPVSGKYVEYTDASGKPTVNSVWRGFIVQIDDANDIVKVTTEASWLIGGQTKFSHIYTDFSNWRQR